MNQRAELDECVGPLPREATSGENLVDSPPSLKREGNREGNLLAGWIELGKITGHAPSTCDQCGFVSMISVVTGSGTRRGLKSTGWPRCPCCAKGRRVIAEEDFVGVARVRYRAPQSKPRRVTRTVEGP